MICPYCGSTIDDNSKFCGACGARLEAAAAQDRPSAVQSEPAADMQAAQSIPVSVQPALSAVQSEAEGKPARKYMAGLLLGFVCAVLSAALAVFNLQRMNGGKLFYFWCGIPVHIIFAVLALFFLILGIVSLAYRKQTPAKGGEKASGKRSLYGFEIAVLLAVPAAIGITVYILNSEALGDRFMEDHYHHLLLAAAAVPGLLSLLPASPAAKGKKAPGLAVFSFIIVILLVLIYGFLCVSTFISSAGVEIAGCMIVSAVLAVILFIQSIRRLRR